MSFKVRHYRSRIYNPLKKKILEAGLAVLAAVLLFALGWFSYEPLMDGLTKKNKEIINENPVIEPEKKETIEEVHLSFTEKNGVSITVPVEKLYSSSEYFNFLKSLPEYVDSIVIDMKTRNGTVTYQSSQKSVISAGSMDENAVNLKSRIDTARNLGYDVVGRICAFEDAIAPYNASEMAVKYENEDGVLWLDDSYDNGGKPWMNPYSDTAQKYVMDIVYDAIDFGLDAVIVDGMRFPGDTGQQYAYYGVNSESVSRNEILKQFSQRLYEATAGSETDIIIVYDAYSVISGKDNIYGGSPAVFSGDALSPVIDISSFVGSKDSQDFYYKTMPEDITDMTKSIYDGLSYATDICIYPTIITNSIEKNQLRTLMDTLEECGADGFIIEYSDEFYGEKQVSTATDLTATDIGSVSYPAANQDIQEQ